MNGFAKWLENDISRTGYKDPAWQAVNRQYWKDRYGYTDAQYDRLQQIVDNDDEDDPDLPRIPVWEPTQDPAKYDLFKRFLMQIILKRDERDDFLRQMNDDNIALVNLKDLFDQPSFNVNDVRDYINSLKQVGIYKPNDMSWMNRKDLSKYPTGVEASPSELAKIRTNYFAPPVSSVPPQNAPPKTNILPRRATNGL